MLCIIGSITDPQLRGRLHQSPHVRTVPTRPYSELPANLVVGDLICLFSDPASEITKYQMPAKFTDALAMGIPIMARPSPALAEQQRRGLVIPVTDDPLDEQLASVLGDIEAHRERAELHRVHFLEEFSYAAVSPRLAAVVRAAIAAPRSPLPAEMQRVLAYQRERFRHPIVLASHAPLGGTKRQRRDLRWPRADAAVGARGPSCRLKAGRRRSDGMDIVCFWKQNDSGIYGRRNDMLAEHLARSETVNRVIHFDAPISYKSLARLAAGSIADAPNQNRAVFRATMNRMTGVSRRVGKLRRYTFVYSDPDQDSRLARIMFPQRGDHVSYVADVLAKNGIGDRSTLLLVWPHNFDAPAIAEALDWDLVLADVVDDERTWARPGSAHYRRLERNYRDVLGLSDIVLANCAPVQDRMRAFADEVLLVPNGCDLRLLDRPHRVPRELRRLDGPIIGYVGNLSSRIDIDLLRGIAVTRPDWNLVLIGSAHLTTDVFALDQLPNVHFLGVKRYPQVADYIRAFDVAIVPHLNDPMTQAMHPLKALVYCSLGVPTVSTPIANLGTLSAVIRTADGAGRVRGGARSRARRRAPNGGGGGAGARAAKLLGHRAAAILDLAAEHPKLSG